MPKNEFESHHQLQSTKTLRVKRLRAARHSMDENIITSGAGAVLPQLNMFPRANKQKHMLHMRKSVQELDPIKVDEPNFKTKFRELSSRERLDQKVLQSIAAYQDS